MLVLAASVSPNYSCPMTEPWSRHLTQNDRIGCVCICGGTHGNETNGVYLARNFSKIQGPPGGAHGFDFELKVIESNPEAVKKNVRYTEEDLNRCFTCKDLGDPDHVKLYEHRRAKEINQLLGPKTSPTPVCDYILDLHNTTAATGVALLMHPRDKFSQELAAYLQSIDSTVRVALWADRDVMLLPSVGRSGMTFEVGPVPCGCLNAVQYKQSETLVKAAMTYMTAHNNARKRAADGSTAKRVTAKLQCIQLIQTLAFPRDADKELLGMIHPALDGKDFLPLRAGDPVFLMFDGSEKTLADVAPDLIKTEGVIYPFLVNETSYYEKDIAFMAGRLVDYQVEHLVI